MKLLNQLSYVAAIVVVVVLLAVAFPAAWLIGLVENSKQ